MKTPTAIKSLCAGILTSVLSASAGIHPLPTPPPSDFADAESSVIVPLPANDGRHIRLSLAFDPSPTNAVQVAFGRDVNADGDLAPEETALRVGYDCGEIQVKDEGVGVQRRSGILSASEQESNLLCTPTPTTYTLKLTKAVSRRWNLVKVTRRGFFSSEPSVTLKPRKPGMMIFVR